jgi:hypothetical protein
MVKLARMSGGFYNPVFRRGQDIAMLVNDRKERSFQAPTSRRRVSVHHSRDEIIGTFPSINSRSAKNSVRSIA